VLKAQGPGTAVRSPKNSPRAPTQNFFYNRITKPEASRGKAAKNALAAHFQKPITASPCAAYVFCKTCSIFSIRAGSEFFSYFLWSNNFSACTPRKPAK